MNLDFIVAILTGLAVIVPFIIPWLEKRDKLKKTVYLIELIKTKEELEKIVSKVQETNSSPILLSKLKTNLQEIEDDINFSKRKYNVNGFYLVISVEIFFLFSFLSSIIIQKSWESGLHFLEGVFSYPATRIAMILLVILISFIVSEKISKYFNIKTKTKNVLVNDLIMVVLFNISILVLGILGYLLLFYSDPFIPWF